MDGLGKDLTGIAMALIGVSLVALLVGHSSNTTAIIQQGGSTFNDLLQTVTLQNGGSLGLGGMSNLM